MASVKKVRSNKTGYEASSELEHFKQNCESDWSVNGCKAQIYVALIQMLNRTDYCYMVRYWVYVTPTILFTYSITLYAIGSTIIYYGIAV